MSASSSAPPPKSTARVSLRNLFKLPKKSASRSKSSTSTTSFFEGASNVKIINSNLNEIHGDATIIRFGDGQFTDVQRNLICDYIANLTVLPDINDNLKRHVLMQSIISIPRAEAVYNDYQTKKKSGPCFEGTRVALLREMADWAVGQGESKMYVLSGLAGIGKSTVAYTIASRAAGIRLLGASFFFSRDEADRKNAKRFFTTIAYQLCVYDETFAKAIGNVLLTERGSAATTKDPQEQLQVLILDPLRSIVQSRARPILVVVDALDECDEEDGHAVVTGLSQLVRLLPSFKVILTTRPQPLVNYLFGNDDDSHKMFHLQDIENKVVDGDIRLYLSYSFSLEQVRMRLLNSREEWCASDEDIESLVKAAGRLFIIASTAVLYVLSKPIGDPGSRMKKLLGEIAQDRTPFHALNHFYSVIVRSAIQVDDDDDDIVDRYQIIVGTIVVLQTPLSVATLACLIDEEPKKIYAMLRNLQSVILLGSDDVPRVYHKSFTDYLTDQARCKDPRLRIDPRIRHTQIATRCFEIMDKHLKYNILGLGDPARFMSNEDGLKKDGITDEQLQDKIFQQLRYACVYWANHLEYAKLDHVDLMNGLSQFADEHMLYWLEVLSLVGKLDSAHRSIRVVLKLLKSTSSDLYQLLSDAFRFISKFYEIIKQSALHTYHSALSFTPKESLLYRRYIKEAEHNICTVDGGPEKWDALVANLNHEESVDVIKFSLDSALFVSWSEDNHIAFQGKLKIRKLHIWDGTTGTPISTISGLKFAVANDFSTIASSKDKTITCYNSNGSARGTIFTTSSKIQKLALSSESGRIAAALSDGTVWLWDSRDAKVIDSFDDLERSAHRPRLQFFPDGTLGERRNGDSSDEFEDNAHRSRLQFSLAGTRLAYSSVNDILKVRDGISGRFIADLQCGPKYDFEFSGDGSRIASLSDACGLTLWNSENGEPVDAVKNVVGGNGLAVSANGSLLATGDHYNRVKFWSGNNLKDPFKVLELFVPLRSITFSPDNILGIATILGIKLYNVDTHSFIATLPFNGGPTALAFSPDYSYLAAGNVGGSVRLWDIRGINASSSPSKAEATNAAALALSRDCSRLACVFWDGTVELWATSPTKRQIASHQGHPQMASAAVEFKPDGGLFASGSNDGTIQLWNGGDGTIYGTLRVHNGLRAVALSNSVLVAGWDGGVTLWSLDTLILIHTFKKSGPMVSAVSIAENSALVAVAFSFSGVSLLDVVNHTTITTFDGPYVIRTMAFLPDNSQLVAQSSGGAFLSLNLVDKHVTSGPTFDHFIQLSNTPLWHGVPILCCWDKEQCYFAALFSQHENPVPVLQIPREIRVKQWAQGSSLIVLGCEGGRVILLRLPTSHVAH